MKHYLFTLLGLLGLFPAYTQNTGVVTFEEKIKLEIKIDGADEQMLANLPKERTSQKVLLFTPEATLYQGDKTSKASDDMDSHPEDGARVMIKMKAPEDIVYCDLKSNKLIEQRDFMSRKFLIESDPGKMQWKITGNQKMILNYPCQEAILQDTSKKIIVWFTSSIPVFSGPNGYANLPGLILALDSDDGKYMLTALKVEMKEIDKAVITKPKEGKKVTKEEYEKIKEEKRKEMNEEFGGGGGGGNVIIKIKN